jgi:Ca-activated chloride channel family protein
VAIGSEGGRVSGNIQAFPRQEFDLPTLIEIARVTGGEHFWAQDLESLESTFQTIDRLEKTESKSQAVIDDDELFPWFLIAAVLSSLAAITLLALNPAPSP